MNPDLLGAFERCPQSGLTLAITAGPLDQNDAEQYAENGEGREKYRNHVPVTLGRKLTINI